MSLAVICSLYLIACNVQDFDSSSGLSNSPHGPSIVKSSGRAPRGFTVELFADGLARLTWPRDPSATSYIVVFNRKLSVSVPASELSIVVKTRGRSASNRRFTVYSVDASNVRSRWVSRPHIIRHGQHRFVTAPVEELLPIDEPALVEEPATDEDVALVEEPAADEDVALVEEPATDEDIALVEEPATDEDVALVEEPATDEDVALVEEPAADDDVALVEEPAADEDAAIIEEASPTELVNQAPDITNTSYNCDPVVESVVFDVGQTDYFTLSVSDESPLTLTYSVDSSEQGIVDVTVDDDGIFTISALQVGDTFIWLSAEDEEGLVDEYEMRVVVQ